jgi:hypothetical protein
VVGDVHDDGVQQKLPVFACWPALMDTFFCAILRASIAAAQSFLAETRQAIWLVDNNLPPFQKRTLKNVCDRSMARTSFVLVMLALAGGMALVLGVVRIYSVIAYAVSQRTREIGIRMGIGAVIGLVAACVVTRLMTSLLFGVTSLDPATYAVVSALASYLPSRRTTSVDPIDAPSRQPVGQTIVFCGLPGCEAARYRKWGNPAVACCRP